jgi:acetyl esterase/lipase
MRDGMKYFWNSYTTSEAERALITVSPLRATLDDLAGFPPTLVINAEADVLRDEGELFAGRLREAGVTVTQVRFAATIHDFVMLNSLHDTQASKTAVALAAATLKAALHA